VTASYLPRLIDGRLAAMLAGLPAVLVLGPRAAGKTTTAALHARTVVRLDRATEAVGFEADPDVALRGLPEPVLLDEWQAVPGVLGAVKRAVDDDPRPGRFLITGSARADLDASGWPGTGRLTRLTMLPLTVREASGRDLSGPTFLDQTFDGGDAQLAAPPDPPDLRGYLELAVRGGFPEAVLRVPADLRLDWQDSYLDQLVTRDVETISGGRDPRRLARFVEVYALNTAGVVSDTTIYGAAGVDRRTAAAYEALLASLLVVDSIPAWSTNRLKRLVRTPKRYLVDSGLAAGALKIDAAAALRDGNLLGRLLDTFVVAQLRAELAVAVRRPRLYHLRQEGGVHEVDLVVEYPDRTVVGIEVKASAAPRLDSARHLAWFRDTMGSAFRLGIVLHTGSYTYALGERLLATPISALWA